MVSAGVEVVRINCGKYRVWDVPGEGGDEFGGSRLEDSFGFRRPLARHQLANCRSNALSLSHGLSPWLGLGPVARLQPCRRPAVLCTRITMGKQEKSVHKKRGRPPGRRYGETIPMRLSPELKDKVDLWANRQPDKPSRSEALRRLVEMALKLKRN